MDRLTVEECVEVIKFHYKKGGSAVFTFMALRADCCRQNPPIQQI